MSRPWWTMEAPPVPQQTTINPRPGGGDGGGGGHSGGSVGMLVVVLAAITILGVLAGAVARICGGRHLTGDGDYDFEGWVETKCSTCIDGSLGGGGGGAAHAPPKIGDAPPPKTAAAGDEEEKKDGDCEKSPEHKAE